jgi:hypothetical protein
MEIRSEHVHNNCKKNMKNMHRSEKCASRKHFGPNMQGLFSFRRFQQKMHLNSDKSTTEPFCSKKSFK